MSKTKFNGSNRDLTAANDNLSVALSLLTLLCVLVVLALLLWARTPEVEGSILMGAAWRA